METPTSNNSIILKKPSRESISKKLTNLIQDGQLAEAFEVIKSWSPKDTLEKRIALHFEGMIYVHMGALNKAKSKFLKASSLGENIKLLTDLAACYYQLGEVDQWRNSYNRMSWLISDLREQLSFESRFNSSIMLAKFFEEEAQIEKSLNIYESCFKEIQDHRKESEKMASLCLAQIIRLKASFGRTDDLGSLYTQLLTKNKSLVSKDLNIEIQHSLMLSEISLVGVGHAWFRVKSCLEDNDISAQDKQLIFYDFIEECLQQKKQLPENLNPEQFEKESLGDFEHEIHILAFEKEKKKEPLELSWLASQLPWSNYLRLLILYLSLEDSMSLKKEIVNKIDLILESLDQGSRSFWKKKIQFHLREENQTLEYCPQKRSVLFKDKILDISRKKSMITILESLCENSKTNVDDIIKKIWNTSYTPEHFHRLRMTVHRLNSLFSSFTGNSKIVEINSESVYLRPDLKLKEKREQSTRDSRI